MLLGSGELGKEFTIAAKRAGQYVIACDKYDNEIVPSARAVNYTMNRRAIRDLAAKELGLRTAKYFYAKTFGVCAPPSISMPRPSRSLRTLPIKSVSHA